MFICAFIDASPPGRPSITNVGIGGIGHMHDKQEASSDSSNAAEMGKIAGIVVGVLLALVIVSALVRSLKTHKCTMFLIIYCKCYNAFMRVMFVRFCRRVPIEEPQPRVLHRVGLTNIHVFVIIK